MNWLAALAGIFLAGASALAAPVIGVEPTGLSAVLAPGETATQALTVRNQGSDPLDWSVLNQNTVVSDFRREAALVFEPSEYITSSAVIDPAGRYAYFGTSTSPGQIVKVDVQTWQRVGAITLAQGEGDDIESFLFSAVMDPAGHYAYFGTGTYPGKVIKVDLERFERVGSLTLEAGEEVLRAAVIDPSGQFAYFGSDSYPAHIVKIDLASFTRVGALDFDESMPYVNPAAAIDPSGQFAYFGLYFGNVVKIDLASFSLVDTIDTGVGTLLGAALVEPNGQFAYFGTYGDPGQVLKIDLANFSLSDTLTLEPGEARPTVAVMSNDGSHAYFGTRQTAPGRVIKIDLANFARVGALTLNEGEDDLRAAVADPTNDEVYFATATFPARLVKVVDAPHSCALPAWASVTPGSGTVAGGVSQAIDVGFDTAGLPIGRHDGALCLQSNDPATPRVVVPLTADVRIAEVSAQRLTFDLVRGEDATQTLSVSNHGSGDLAWTITQGDPALGCATPANASWLGVSPANGSLAPGSSTNFGASADASSLAAGSYPALLCLTAAIGADTQTSAIAVDLTVRETTPSFAVEPGSLVLDLAPGQSGNAELSLHNSGTGALDWSLSNASAAAHLRDSLTFGANEGAAGSAVIDADGRYAYFGTNTAPGQIVKLDLQTFERVAAIALPAGDDYLRSAVIDPSGRYAYFGARTIPGRVVKIDLADFTRVGAITLADGEENPMTAAIDPAGAYAYFGTATETGQVVKIDLTNFTRVGAVALDGGQGEGYLNSAAIDPSGQFAYFGGGVLTGFLVKIDLASFARVGAILIAEDQGVSEMLISSNGEFAYAGTTPPFIGAGRVAQVDLAAFEPVNTVELDLGNYESEITSMVFGAQDRTLYAATSWGSATRLVEIDLQSFFRVGPIPLGVTEGQLPAAVVDPAGRYAYFGGQRYPGDLGLGRTLKIELGQDCARPSWLSTDSDSGNVPAGETTTLGVGANAGALAPGAYAANLCFASNDPAAPMQIAPVTLNVATNDRIFADGFESPTP